jgi:hypothetical protein
MNWMTWIAPNNFALANITGSYGGMGFNPISTLDWNTAGKSSVLSWILSLTIHRIWFLDDSLLLNYPTIYRPSLIGTDNHRDVLGKLLLVRLHAHQL